MSEERVQAVVEHDLSPIFKLILTSRPGAFEGGPTYGEVDGCDEFTIANNDNQPYAIHAGDHTLVLATVSVSDEFKVLAIFSKHRVILHPGPLPVTSSGLTHRLDVSLKGRQDTRPSLRRRLCQERLSKALKRRDGRFLSHLRTQVNS